MKTRNEILECNEGDRYIFIQYDETESLEWLNFHQGIGDLDLNFNKPCEKLTEIYRALTNGKDADERFYFKKDLTNAIELYTKIVIFPEMETHVWDSKKLDTYRATVKYFQSLISITNTYFLSDYVESELGDYLESVDEFNHFIKQLDKLKVDCKKYGLDIHEISQEVATPFIEAIGSVTCPNCKHKF